MYVGFALDNIKTYKDIIKGLEYTKSIGGNYLQFYVGSSYLTTLREKIYLSKDEINNIKKLMKKYDIKIVFHGLVRLNFCSDPEYPRYKWGIENLIYDMKLAKSIGAEGVVVHLGNYKTKKFEMTYKECIKNFIKSLTIAVDNCKTPTIFLETSVARQNSIGGTIEELAEIYNKIPVNYRKHIKICLDTAHIFLAGYDIRDNDKLISYFNKFDKLIGLKNLKLIHLNDTNKELGSHINRHASLGKGLIYKDKNVLKNILEIANKNDINIILETEKKEYKREIKLIKNIINKKKLIQKGGEKSKTPNKDKIIEILEKMLIYYKNQNNNKIIKYKIESYERCIKTLKNYKGEISSSKNIKHLPYIGSGFLKKIDEIIKTGTLKQLKTVGANKINFNKEKNIMNLSKVFGIGNKTINNLKRKKIYSINNLKKAVKNKKIKLSNQQIIGLKYVDKLVTKIPRKNIIEITKNLDKNIRNCIKDNYKIINAGSFRAGKDFSGDIDLIISLEENRKLEEDKKIKDIVKCIDIKEILLIGEKKIISIIEYKKKFYQMDILITTDKYLPWYLLYFGSNKEFSKKIRLYASKQGYKLNEKGLYDKTSGKRINFNPITEKEIFDYLKIKYIKPEDREFTKSFNHL